MTDTPNPNGAELHTDISRRALLSTIAGAAALSIVAPTPSNAEAIKSNSPTTKESTMSSGKVHFTPENSAILLVDHQPGVLGMVGSLPHDVVIRNTSMLARLGDQLGIPLVITSTRETIEFLGTTLKEVREAAPTAYEKRIRRGGSLDAFSDPAFVAAVKATGRKNLIIAGILTDVCLAHSVKSALAAGYHVEVVADASGTTTPLADAVTYDLLRDLGATVTTAYGVLFDLYPDLSKPEGLKAEAVATASAAPSK
ncbi:isochorismatase family protein [Rhizobium sp. NZLR1]|uniref:isochorismatase family protein n=1 Tax=Rhizobium sp. NZLR1 TaxID=2731096 RepID=UPI001A98C841|nr:isochorismatase family protein [Rhizobium sp. NZLR1]MBX5204055.1 isochorismatase family protein [Rhizobium sp. NZLR1]QSZ25147.1 isochorismatase family protein [Rhizobium sp. NZLR1]